MSSLTVTLILFSLLLLLLFLNVPLVVSIGLPTALIMLGSGMKVATLAQRTYASVDSFTLMAIQLIKTVRGSWDWYQLLCH